MAQILRPLRTAAIALAIALAPDSAAAEDQSALIGAAIRSGRLVQARTMLSGLGDSAKLPKPADSAALWADLALAEGRDEDALQAFDALASTAPDSCAFLIGGGIAASRTGRPDRAIASLERATTRCDVDWIAWNALGQALDAKERWQASASAYAHALALHPTSAALLNNIGMSLQLQHRFANAVDYFGAALRIAPGNVRIVNNLDIARASIGLAPVRVIASDDAARWAERLGNAGRAAMLAGRVEDARAWLAQAVTTSPTYQPGAITSLAQLQARR